MAIAQPSSRELKYYLERKLGAPIVEMQRSHSQYGYELRAANGNSMFLDMQMAYQLVGGAEPRDVYRFPMYNEPMAYTVHMDRYSQMPIEPPQLYGAGAGGAGGSIGRSYEYDPRIGISPVLESPYAQKPSPPKRDLRKEKSLLHDVKLRKLFWHRYSKTGKYPFSTLTNLETNVQK